MKALAGPVLVIVAGLAVVVAARSGGAPGGVRASTDPTVIATIRLGWDGYRPVDVAVNLTTNRIYAANEGSANVSVIDGGTNAVVATVPVGLSAQGVAVNPSTNRIYVVGGWNNVSVIDGATNSILGTALVGVQPRAVAVNPTTNRIYVANEQSDTVSVIDGATNTVVATVPVGDHPWGVAANPATNRVYVANTFGGNVSVIDGATNTVVATVPMGSGPLGVAVNPSTNRIYVAGGYNVSVVDGTTNTVVATVPVGDYPWGVAANPATNRVYVANANSNNVSVINGASNTVVATVPVGSCPRAVAANPTTNRIYVANPNSNNVSVIEGATNGVVATVSTGSGPYYAAVNLTTNRIYVTNPGSNNVSVIDGASNTVVATVPVGSGPLGVAVNPTTNRIYVANWASDNVSVIDGASSTVVATIPVGGQQPEPSGVAVNPTTNRIYVTDRDISNVSVIDGASNTVVATVPVGYWPTKVAVNPTTNRIYVANSSNVSVIDGASNTVVATVPVAGAMAVNPTTNRIYVANGGGNSVSVIDGATNTVVATVVVGSHPRGVAGNPTTNRIYAANESSSNVSVIEGASNTVVATVPVGSGPNGVAANPTTNRIYVANQMEDTVSVIEDAAGPPPTPTPTPTPTATAAPATPTPTVTPLPDLSITSVQAIQVVQEPDNSIPLVKDKATMVRVFPKLENAPEPQYVDGLGVRIPFITGVTVDLDCSQIGCSGLRSLTRNVVYFGGKTYAMTFDQLRQLGQRIRDNPGDAQQKFDEAVFEWGVDAYNFGTGLEWDEGEPFYPTVESSQDPFVITATVDAGNAVPESDDGNNSSGPLDVKVKVLKQPPGGSYDVAFLDLRADTSGGLQLAISQGSYIAATYPYPLLGDDALVLRYGRLADIPFLGGLTPLSRNNCGSLWRIATTLAAQAARSNVHRLVAIVPSGCLGDSATFGIKKPGIDSVVFLAEDAGQFLGQGVTAHEIGHTFGFCEEYETEYPLPVLNYECDTDGNPLNLVDFDEAQFPNGYLAGDGWDLVGAEGQSRPKTSLAPSRADDTESNYFSFMSNRAMKPLEWGIYQWMTYANYRTVLQALLQHPEDPPAVFVSGAVFQDGSGLLHPAYTGDAIPSTSEPGEYAIEALDAGDTVLASVSFAAIFRGPDEPSETEAMPFQVVVPLLGSTRKIVLRGPTGLLDEIQVSDNAPIVSINSVTSVPGTQEFDLDWQAVDADGDQLTVSIDYSHDGVTYQPLALPASDVPSPFRFDTGTLPGGTSVTVRVLATDGVNTGVALSEPFAVADKPPVASVLSPVTGSSVADSVVFQGMGYDPEEFDLQGASLQWFSNVDGPLGEGVTLSTDSLSLGNHTITLVVTDGEGNTASDSIDISFGDNCPGIFNPDQTDTDSDGLGDLCDSDDDNDGCSDSEELGSTAALGGRRDPLNKWDFFDVPVPAIYIACSSPGVCNPVPTKDRVAGAITTDVQALLKYAGAKDTGSNPRYNVDLDGNTVLDGLEYDRTPSAYPDQPWRSGPPDGTAGGITTDVTAMLKQAGHSCAAPP
jgi:YVTN family beta-propeller protein